MFQKIELQIQKTIDYYKEHGLLEFVKRFFGKLGFEHFSRSLIFLVLDLKDIPDDVKKPYSFHIATLADIQNEQDYNDGFFSKEEAIYRLKIGHHLFVLKKNNKMVYSLWVEQKNAAFWWYNNLPIHMPKNIAYISGIHTLPNFRGQGISFNSKKEIFQYLRDNGVSHIIGAVHSANSTALKLNKRFGYQEYQTINYKRYWHIRCYTVKKANSNESKTFISLFRSPKDIWKTFL